jgi:hypothetical protein
VERTRSFYQLLKGQKMRMLLVILALLALQGCAVAFNVAIGNTTGGPIPFTAPDVAALKACKP